MLHGWCHVKCCRFGASSVHTIQPCTRLQCHFIQSHCHLHFWQNDRDLLRATAVDTDRETKRKIEPVRDRERERRDRDRRDRETEREGVKGETQ